MQRVWEWRGFYCLRGQQVPQRVAVFIDYQNVYKGARAAFPPTAGADGHVHGQIRPIALGLVLRGADRELVSVGVYRGLPSPKHDSKGNAAAQRQIAAWNAAGGGILKSCARPLNYRDPLKPREKGVDVQLAIDVVIGAVKREYDVAIVFSNDTDLHPAIEAVGEILGPASAELATWRNPDRRPRPATCAGTPVRIRVLDQTDYQWVQDTTNYTAPKPRAPRPR
jgi:hypothetical protein